MHFYALANNKYNKSLPTFIVFIVNPQKKGKSKKTQQGLSDASKERILQDWWETKVTVSPILKYDPIEAINSLMTIFQPSPAERKKKEEEEKKENEKPKLIIFPLLEKPVNDKENKWGNDRNWTAKQDSNMTTFNSNRDHGKRKYAGRDLYSNDSETTIVCIADGIVLTVNPFYCQTDEVTIRHTLTDGRDFIIRYGELDSKSITVKVGDKVTQKQKIGKIGKLLKYLPKEKNLSH